MSMISNLPQNVEILKNKTFHFGVLKKIGSIPAQRSLEDHELPVLGTYVHNHILPGIKYRVRLTGTNDFLFGGKAMKLESIGQGYGKRITFESDDILENNNFFWSDSHEAGFAFSAEILPCGEVFRILDGQGKSVGSFSVTEVSEKQQITSVTHEEDGLNISGKVSLSGVMQLAPQTTLFCEDDFLLAGEVVVKVNRFSCTLEFLKTEYSVLHFVKHFK